MAIRFEKTSDHNYTIRDDVLKRFLLTHTSIVAKTIFFLSTELCLTDKNRNVICTVRWNNVPIIEYLDSVNTSNRTPICIKPLTIEEAKEDIITFASVELYKKLNYDLLAVSYPGAQGDRCILTGSGRNVLRTYVDIIAYKTNGDEIQVFLEECKRDFSGLHTDVDKLNKIVSGYDEREGLKKLFCKTISRDSISDLYISVAAKKVSSLPRLIVDYMFMFGLSSDIQYTYIDYTVALVNTTLVTEFSPLVNNGRLIGRLKINRLYIIE